MLYCLSNVTDVNTYLRLENNTLDSLREMFGICDYNITFIFITITAI